ncbi:hypothetical protein [Xanthomonas sp. GPE 39]|uniref:hypothetical protein n=1 Tax=Xanthomonas sp. GPE 39 TaxID=1583099 RepID=UPI000A43F13D|nr:hypothetical protein [Xanthomonas sp. GPE 39]
MAADSTKRHFRKSVMCAVFALAAVAVTSAGAQQTQAANSVTYNYNLDAKYIMIKNAKISGGETCTALSPPQRDAQGNFTGPGVGRGQPLLVGFTFNMQAMRDPDCTIPLDGIYQNGYVVRSTKNLFIRISKSRILVSTG